jgi:ATP-dependent Clp protease ATP-binding subunit ClpB
VIGRDKEIRKLVEILGKRLSPNVMITGDSGVGKTAIIGGLALNILENRVPDNLKGATIFELDVNGRLVAGAYKGEVEERLKSTLKAIKDYGKAILFIDEIHALLDEQSSVGSGAVNLLKPELARGELTVIGATTSIEYRKHVETDEAFSRRFTALEIGEPDEEKAIEMLRGLAPRFEQHHQLQVDKEAIPEAVRLSRRYLSTKKLPVSAIELLDLSLSSLRVMNDTSTMELDKLRNELDALAFSEQENEESRKRRLRQFHEEARGRLSHILISRVENLFTFEPEAPSDQAKQQLSEMLDLLGNHSSQKTEVVGKDEIAAMVSYMTGIPLGKIQSQEQEKILNLESLLMQRVVGQDYALKMVADTLRRSRADLKEADKPNGVFFFVGPTGTGKTELAKAIAELLFNDERALIRFDMSEFKEEHSAALLYGAPPGYVGYKEGGLLVNKIRQKPYSVVLFDEIEKAHPSVYDIFLQIVDEGVVTDKQDKKGRFANAIVIFTSNLGSDWIVQQYKQGKVPEKNELRTFMQNLRDIRGNNVFRPEFLGRKISLVPFGPITQEIAPQILSIHLGNFARLLRRQNVGLELTEKARAKLVELGFSEAFGARPLKDSIDDYLGTPISEMIIRQEVLNGGHIFVDSNPKSEEPFVWRVENKQMEMIENSAGEAI